LTCILRDAVDVHCAWNSIAVSPEVAAALPLYCQHSVPAEKGAIHNKIVTGKAAVTHKLDALTKKTDLTFEGLTEVHVYCSRLSRRPP